MRCNQCPKPEELKSFLYYKVEDVKELITFKQWTAVDRMEWISRQLVVREFIEMLIKEVVKLMPHSYIVKQQYLKKRKEDLYKTLNLVLMNFSEN